MEGRLFPRTQSSAVLQGRIYRQWRDSLEAFINLIKAPDKDCLCTLRMSKEVTIIPQGPSRKLPCRADTGPVTSRPAGVETYETLETVKKESVPRIEIEVHDSSQHDIILPGRTQLGRLRLVVCYANEDQIGKTRHRQQIKTWAYHYWAYCCWSEERRRTAAGVGWCRPLSCRICLVLQVNSEK